MPRCARGEPFGGGGQPQCRIAIAGAAVAFHQLGYADRFVRLYTSGCRGSVQFMTLPCVENDRGAAVDGHCGCVEFGHHPHRARIHPEDGCRVVLRTPSSGRDQLLEDHVTGLTGPRHRSAHRSADHGEGPAGATGFCGLHDRIGEVGGIRGGLQLVGLSGVQGHGVRYP